MLESNLVGEVLTTTPVLGFELPRIASSLLPAILVLSLGTSLRCLTPGGLLLSVYAIGAATLFQSMFLIQRFFENFGTPLFSGLYATGFLLVALVLAVTALALLVKPASGVIKWSGLLSLCLVVLNPVYFQSWVIELRSISGGHDSPWPIAASDIAAAATTMAIVLIVPSLAGAFRIELSSSPAVRLVFRSLSTLVLAVLSASFFHSSYQQLERLLSENQL